MHLKSLPLLVALTTQISGLIRDIRVLPGHSIRIGDYLMMIGEIWIKSDCDGVVINVLVKSGEAVTTNTPLLEVDVRSDALQRLRDAQSAALDNAGLPPTLVDLVGKQPPLPPQQASEVVDPALALNGEMAVAAITGHIPAEELDDDAAMSTVPEGYGVPPATGVGESGD